jgi:DNA polymerase III delta subunit
MDTIAIFTAGIKRYIFTAIDVRTRFAFAYAYTSNSSANGRDFLKKFTSVAPFAISHIQTDNGGEFLKHFSQSCQDILFQEVSRILAQHWTRNQKDLRKYRRRLSLEKVLSALMRIGTPDYRSY